MNHEKIIAELCALRNHGSKFGIDRMKMLSAELGVPESAFPCIHLAGTNGKGSTAAMLDAILRQSGLKTGLYTSPHLVKLGERIQIGRKALSDAEICAFAEEIYEAAKKFGAPGDEDFPSFFEVMTAMAFLHFARERCDAAVLETGLGGRFDATNVVVPEVSVITSIGLDHCEFLGNDIEKIAFEKAGIVKNGVPVVVGCVPEAAESVIRKIAAERNSPIFSVRERFGNDVKAFPRTNLEGAHQRKNAATATIAAEIFLEKIGKKIVPAAFNSALQNVSWAARWETKILGDGQKIVVDVAHNAECAVVLAEMLRGNFLETKARPIVICGVLGAERARPILSAISQFAAKIILVRPKQERACTLEELRKCVPADFAGEVVESSVPALFPQPNFCAEKPKNGGTVVVAGSCYLAGEVLSALGNANLEAATGTTLHSLLYKI